MTDQDKLIQIVQARGEKAISLELVREGKKETIAITPQRRKSDPGRWKRAKAEVGDLFFSGVGLFPDQPRPGGDVGSGTVFADYNNVGNVDYFVREPTLGVATRPLPNGSMT